MQKFIAFIDGQPFEMEAENVNTLLSDLSNHYKGQNVFISIEAADGRSVPGALTWKQFFLYAAAICAVGFAAFCDAYSAGWFH